MQNKQIPLNNNSFIAIIPPVDTPSSPETSNKAGQRRLRTETSSFSLPVDQNFYVKSVTRVVDLDKQYYAFKILLDNGHSFEVIALLSDLLDENVYGGMPWSLVSETFDEENPGFSLFVYDSADGTSMRMQNHFPSIDSRWIPSPSQPIVELKDKWTWRSGMSNINWSIRFSDGSGANVGYDNYTSGVFNLGDKFFKVGPHLLVNIQTGRVVNMQNPSEERYIPITWEKP